MPIDMRVLIRRLRQAREAGDEEEAERLRKLVVTGEGAPAAAASRETEEAGSEAEDQGPARASLEGGPAPEEPEEPETGEPDEDGEKVGLTPGFGTEKQYYWEQEDISAGLEEHEDDEEVDLKYPLIPKNPDENERVYAWAHITYDENDEGIVYRLHEPDLTPEVEHILADVEDRLKETIDVDFGEMKRDEAREFLEERIGEILRGRDFSVDPETREVVQYYAYRDFVGLGKIEPLMNDKYIEDISCDGTGIPVYAYHRNPDVASVPTDITFEDEEQLDSFVRKLAQRCGRSVSMAEPLVDGSLPDGSRVQATLATDIARRGSNFTIRKFTEDPLTPIDIKNFGTVNAQMLAYFWLAIENGKSMLIAGPTAAGKTSLLNALSLFIPPELKIISIEDTPELRLPHPNWVPEVARSGFGFGSQNTGEVTLDDLLEESLRQRPDYIIVGEVRGEEAYILFQQIATGHPGMSTIHASSLQKVMDRLTTRPINLPPSLIENLDVIIFIKRMRRQGKYVRRVDAVYELEGFDAETEEPQVNKLFDWDASTDEFRLVNESSILAEIAQDRGVNPSKLQHEIRRRRKIIEWMEEQDITHYTEVGQVSSNYYRHPRRVLERIEMEV